MQWRIPLLSIRTGELEKMLGNIADFYDDEVDASFATLTSDHQADRDGSALA